MRTFIGPRSKTGRVIRMISDFHYVDHDYLNQLDNHKFIHFRVDKDNKDYPKVKVYKTYDYFFEKYPDFSTWDMEQKEFIKDYCLYRLADEEGEIYIDDVRIK